MICIWWQLLLYLAYPECNLQMLLKQQHNENFRKEFLTVCKLSDVCAFYKVVFIVNVNSS